MKYILRTAILLALALSTEAASVVGNLRLVPAIPPLGIPTAVLWDYDFIKNKPCALATQANCVISFTVSTVNVSNTSLPPVPVGTPTTLSVLTMPPGNPTGVTVGISVPYTAQTSFGWYMVSVTVNFNDASGVTQKGINVGLSYFVGPDGVLNLRTTP